MARPRTDTTEAFGTDSFLDIVCNMTGIIILLVLVVGLRLKDAPIALAAEMAAAESAVEAEPLPPAALPAIEKQIGRGQAALAGADEDQQSLEQALSAARQAAAAREQENQKLGEQLNRTRQW